MSFTNYLKQTEIAIQATNALVSKAVLCDICNVEEAVKIVKFKTKYRRRYGKEDGKLCIGCLRDNT